MEKIRVGIVLVGIVLLIGFVQAQTTCNLGSISLTNEHTSQSFTCTNNDNLTSVTLNYYGSYADIDKDLIHPSESETITLSMSSGVPTGNYGGLITFSDDSEPIQVSISKTDSNPCNLNPSMSSFTQSIQTGTKIPLNKITFNPINCNEGSLIYDSSHIYIEGGIIAGGINKPILISSIVSDGVNIEINTEGLSSQTYQSKLKVNAFNKIFEIPFTIIVTSGTNPNSNFSLSQLPVCSLSANVLNINNSYYLSCTGLVPDLTILPVYDDNYLIGKNSERTTNQLIWYFTPKKYGNTIIKAMFFYKSLPVGESFSQEIKISSSSALTEGTNLRVIFNPKLSEARPGDEIIINLVDNKTGNLVNEPQIFIDSLPLNTSDGYTFKKSFENGKVYLIRAKALGYNDLVINATLLSKPMTLTVSPTMGNTNTNFIISTDVNTSKIYINGELRANNSITTTLNEGNNTIKATADGYYDIEKTIFVGRGNYASLGSVWEKGTEQLIFLSSNSTWRLTHAKSYEDTEETIKESNSTTLGEVVFTPKKPGVYRIYLDGDMVFNQEITGWDREIIGLHYIWWLVIIAVIVILVLIVKMKKPASSSGMPEIMGHVNYNQ